MGRPRKRARESDHSNLELRKGIISDGLRTTDRMATAEPDISGSDFRSSTTQPPRTIDNDITGPSTWDHQNTMDPSLGSPNGWDVTQSLDHTRHPSPGASQTNFPLHRGENLTAATEQNARSTSALQTSDFIGVSCPCLNELYSMLMSFQSLPPPSFPSSRGPLIEATNLARRVVRCPYCPQDYPSALQNLMLLTTLLPLVAYGYGQLLKHVQERAAQGCTITYRVGDPSLAAAHLHTGTADCPMGFNVDLNSEEWGAMARKVLKQDVYGNTQSIDCLVSVVEELEQRQYIWHLLQPFGADVPVAPCRDQQTSDPSQHNGLCTQLTGGVRRAIEALNL
ncbi:MAG: hypothetical protein Q9225_002828 [Loekoesia sp. 1 TL-2023]